MFWQFLGVSEQRTLDMTAWKCGCKPYWRHNGNPSIWKWNLGCNDAKSVPMSGCSGHNVSVTVTVWKKCETYKIYTHQLYFIYSVATASTNSHVLVLFRPSGVDSLQMHVVLLSMKQKKSRRYCFIICSSFRKVTTVTNALVVGTSSTGVATSFNNMEREEAQELS